MALTAEFTPDLISPRPVGDASEITATRTIAMTDITQISDTTVPLGKANAAIEAGIA
jgi:hypothetical protein